MKFKAGPLGKFLVILAVVAGVGYTVNHLGYFEQKQTVASSVPDKIEMSVNAPAASVKTVTAIPKNTDAKQFTVVTIPWNANAGLYGAVGDETTAPGSIMDKHNVQVKLQRQNDYSVMLAEQVKFAMNNNEGAAFVVIMGDGYPAYIAGAMEMMSKQGQQLEVIAAIGYSRGEDKCLMKPEVKANPQKARGSLVGAVLRDGDWNICVKFAADNGIPINPDEKTYDPNAMNFIAYNSFQDSDDGYIGGHSEVRPVVVNGKLTGEKRKVVQDGTATWTPGDVKVAKKKGGVVPVASTKDKRFDGQAQYMWQMPAVIIGNKQWMEKNRNLTINFIAAALEGGEAVLASDEALTKAMNVQAKVYNEETGAYWKKYFKGVTETDITGNKVELGGSSVMGLGDNAHLFGLNGNDNLYKRIYTVFGNIAVKYYPDVMPKLIPYEDVVNTSYLQELLDKSSNVSKADVPTYVENAPVKGVFAKKSTYIEFASGKATFTGNAVAVLNDVLDNLSIAGADIQIIGHTDSDGNPASNLILSRARADAVKAWLVANAPNNFPTERITSRGYGDTQPIADNKTSDGKAKNRRVEIIMVNK